MGQQHIQAETNKEVTIRRSHHARQPPVKQFRSEQDLNLKVTPVPAVEDSLLMPLIATKSSRFSLPEKGVRHFFTASLSSSDSSWTRLGLFHHKALPRELNGEVKFHRHSDGSWSDSGISDRCSGARFNFDWDSFTPSGFVKSIVRTLPGSTTNN